MLSALTPSLSPKERVTPLNVFDSQMRLAPIQP
jgi:hypothetical protein